MEDLKTAKQVAEALQEPTRRVQYMCSQHHIKPTKIIGSTYLYGKREQELIKYYLYNIQIRGGN